MAIDEFGSALLARQRSRVAQQEDERRREQKRTQKYAIGAVGAQLANNFLQKRAEDFMNSEEINAQQALYKTASRNADRVLRLDESIFNSGMTPEDYFYDQMRPQFEERASQYVSPDRFGPAGAYSAMAEEEVRKLAQERATQFQEALAKANSLVDEEDFEAMLELNAKNARPTNILSYLDSAARRVFSDRSTEDIDAQALESIKSSLESRSADALNVFMDEYNRTGNLVSSFDFTNFVVPEVTEDELYEIVNTEHDYTIVNNQMVGTVTETLRNRNTGALRTPQPRVTDTIDLRTTTPVAELERGMVKEFQSNFNLATDVRNQLTTQAFANYVRELDELELNPANIETAAQYNQVASIYAKYATDPLNLKDEIRDSIQSETLDILINSATEIEAVLAEMEQDPEQREILMQQLISKLFNIFEVSRGLSQRVTSSTQYGMPLE